MTVTKPVFPVYRKYPNNKAFFKILAYDSFEEISFIGSKTIKHYIKATIYPDKILILDMLEMKNGLWMNSTKEEFERMA